jgi:hypothetical protein
MLGLATILFFGVTGVTLNHPDWVFGGAERVVQAEGKVDPRWLNPGSGGSTSGSNSQPDGERAVMKLEIVEHLRSTHGIRGALADFRADERECSVTFKGPGYSADAFIDRETGKYSLTESRHGLIAVINDLHKGRDTGPAWSILIDVSAVAMTVISLTGLVLLFYLKLRRIPGLVVTAVGTIVVVLVYVLWVP